jgi:hypothetical protein
MWDASEGGADGFDLIFSVLVTQNRSGALRQRYSRFDILLYTLGTYAPLPIQSAYLYIELAPEFVSRRDELEAHCARLFGTRLRAMRHERLVTQAAWRTEITGTISRGEASSWDDRRVVWLLQNDDHPFVDVDQRLLREGVRLLRNDTRARFRTLHPSHWGECLKLSGKFETPEVLGGMYVRSRQTLLDAVQLMNYAFFRWQTLEVDWRGRSIKRMDSLVWGSGIYGSRRGALVHTKEHHLHAFYVPLRELCRKFDGYAAGQQISSRLVPPLRLPPEPPFAPRTSASIAAIMGATGRSYWSTRVANNFTLPPTWLEFALRLYGFHGNELDGGLSGNGSSPTPTLPLPIGIARDGAGGAAGRRGQRRDLRAT